MSGQGLDLHAAQQLDFGSFTWAYAERDVILYALSVGCGWNEGRWVYENHEDFEPLPTFALLLIHQGIQQIDMSRVLPKYNPMLLLHGEQYLELRSPLASCSSGLVSKSRILDVKDKGKAAVVVVETATTDKETGQVVAINESTTFIRGSGGFGSTPNVRRRQDAVAENKPPDRPPDATVQEQVSKDQAALYRLNGDYNPLHIDPEFAAGARFDQPILHGLCTFGICCKHVLKRFADGQSARVKSVKGRFAGHVFPGETIVTSMWAIDSATIIFRAHVLERGTSAITNAAVTLNMSPATDLDSDPPQSRL